MNHYYKDDENAPIECQQRILFPDHYDRGAKRRFIKASRRGGLYYTHDSESLTLAFPDVASKERGIKQFTTQLELTGHKPKMK